MALKMQGLIWSICLAFPTHAHAAREHRFFPAVELALDKLSLLCVLGGLWMGGCAPQPSCKLDLRTQAALMRQTRMGSPGAHGVMWKHRMMISTVAHEMTQSLYVQLAVVQRSDRLGILRSLYPQF